MIIELLRKYYGDICLLKKLALTVGGLTIIAKIFAFIRGLYYLSRPVFYRRNLKRRYGEGSYALVTGSTDGIGFQLALVLAERGMNIVLVSRILKKLVEKKEVILKKCPAIEVQIIQCDLSNLAQENVRADLTEQLKKIDISLLVNNVGLDCLEKYSNQKEEDIIKLLNVNIFAVSIMTRILLPSMSARAKRSGIINIGSLSAEIPMTYFNVYGASKLYIEYFTESISREEKKVDFMLVRPSEVSTPMTHNKAEDLLTISPRACALSIIRDFEAGAQKTEGHLGHKIQGMIYAAVPKCLYNFGWDHFVLPGFIKEREMHP